MSPGPISDAYEGSDDEPIDEPDHFPPLTSIEDYPLHGWNYDNRHYACAQDGSMVFDWRCPQCVTEAEKHDPATPTYWKLDEGIEERRVTLGWLVARSRAMGVA